MGEELSALVPSTQSSALSKNIRGLYMIGRRKRNVELAPKLLKHARKIDGKEGEETQAEWCLPNHPQELRHQVQRHPQYPHHLELEPRMTTSFPELTVGFSSDTSMVGQEQLQEWPPRYQC